MQRTKVIHCNDIHLVEKLWNLLEHLNRSNIRTITISVDIEGFSLVQLDEFE